MRLKIGELAKAAGVKTTTVRFYERCGLIPSPTKNAAGYRQYSQPMILRIRFIKNAQELGFTLEEINLLLDLQNNVVSERNAIKQCAKNKIDMIENKLIALTKVKHALQKLHDSCPGHGAIDQGCPILESLGSDEIHQLLFHEKSK